jgi:negative regulator of sigma E activity
MEIDPLRYYMEYLVGEMSGLAERVTSREARVLEVVTVDGVRYSVTSIIEMRDGDTIRATLVPERTQPTINRAL